MRRRIEIIIVVLVPVAVLASLVIMGSGTHPQYASQAKLLFRLPPGTDYEAFVTSIIDKQFARLALAENPALAGAVTKSDIRLIPKTVLAVVSVSASTTNASLEATTMLVDAVTKAGRNAPVPIYVSVVVSPVLTE